MPKKRPRKVSLRGWWHTLPFLLAAFAVLFLFAWLEGQRLKNEYHASALAAEVWEVRASIKKLREQSHYLNRMERMERHAPSLYLIEANPDQIVLIEADGEYVEAPGAYARRERASATRATRSVVFDFDLPPGPARAGSLDAVSESAGSREEQTGG